MISIPLTNENFVKINFYNLPAATFYICKINSLCKGIVVVLSMSIGD